jgi:hypothetical protein
MCLIVDADVAPRVLVVEDDPDFQEVRSRLFSAARGRHLDLVYGGQLRDELLGNASVKRALVVLDRAGRARLIPDDRIRAEIQVVRGIGHVSNDEHIIGLARASGVRVLCSHDQLLHQDFGDSRLLQPRGKIYQNSSHAHLLRRTCR